MKAIIYLTAILVFCAALMISCDSAGDEEQYVILGGRVTEADTTIYVGNVIVTDSKDAAIVDTTDERGYFQLRGVDKARHMIKLECDGYQSQEIEVEYTGKLMRPLISKNIVLIKTEE